MITTLYVNEDIGDIEVFLEATGFHRDDKRNFIVDNFRHYYDGVPIDEVESYIKSNYEAICKMMSDYSYLETQSDDEE
jgi:hypothetical protein